MATAKGKLVTFHPLYKSRENREWGWAKKPQVPHTVIHFLW